MSELTWKINADEILDRRRRFLRGHMPDGILATLPVRLDTEAPLQPDEANRLAEEVRAYKAPGR